MCICSTWWSPLRRARLTTCWRGSSPCTSTRSSSALITYRASCSSRLRPPASSICSDGRRTTWTTSAPEPGRAIARPLANGAKLAAHGPGKTPRSDGGHHERDQRVVAGQRQPQEAKLHLVAGHDLFGVGGL